MSEYLRRQFEDSHVIELRHSHDGRWETSYYKALEPLLDAIRHRADDGNLYTSLNRPDWIPDRALKDDDIGVITRLPFDLDPDRAPDTASTDDEMAAALKARKLLSRLLTSYGWPRPALGMSGNGGHLLYRVRIKSSPAWRRRVPLLYAGLANLLHAELADLKVGFDRTVRNPAQIWRLYGTVNRKGTATDERPHRRAEITLPAGAWQIVPVDVLKRTLNDLEPAVVPRRPASSSPRVCAGRRGDYSTLDAVAWFQAHGAYRRALADGKHAVTCPWIDEHTTTGLTDTVIWEKGDAGWPTFHCSHAHCVGRSLNDVMTCWGDADQFCTQEWANG